MNFFRIPGPSKAVFMTMGACILLSGCNDDFGYRNLEGKQIAFNITASDAWHDGMGVDENEPTTRCVSVQELSGEGDTKLYLHTVVADNPAKKVAITRGTPIKDSETFKDQYTTFSLSGICYTGEYPSDESQNEWTTDYAHNLYYSTKTGEPVEGGRPLYWPHNGKVRFFAFAPTVKDFNEMETGGSLTMSGSRGGQTGSPTLTYTVPTEVTEQKDIMTARTDLTAAPTGGAVKLEFGHALTAVRIVCGKDMLAGTISKVTISGVYGGGTHVIGSETWTPIPVGAPTTCDYTISPDKKLTANETSDDKIHAGEGAVIAGDDNDNFTFILMPQTLPDGASMTIEFTDEATKTSRTLTGPLTGEWKPGKIVTYSISPSSIHINAVVELNKKDDKNDNPDVMPYSGVWYDVQFKAKAEITQAGVETKTLDIPTDKVKFEYKFEGDDYSWVACDGDGDDKGVLKIAPQPAYKKMRESFDTDEGEAGSEDSPVSLPGEYGGESANCYLVDKAGYYPLPLVYGNGNVNDPVEKSKSLNYYPKHDDGRMPADGKITGATDAVLCWQDAPDLIDPGSVKLKDGDLVFRIRKHTLTQGNAVLAVRGGSDPDKYILWSWHIWVTPHKKDFYDYSKFYESTNVDGYSYQLAQYNLGWCDAHKPDASREFRLRAVVDISAYGGAEETPVDIGTFTQEEFKGSDAGDNTYYQWGRKDPMLGGIYNDNTPKYTYKKHGTSTDDVEFTMENKQVFNQYNNQDGYNYSFCKNPGDMVEPSGEASTGVTIGYAIKHPYMFVTNSTEHETDDAFNYRNHWHIPYKDKNVPYLSEKTHILFNAWNSEATDAGYEYGKTGTLANNADIGKKTIYDPCPPKFQVPPIHALKGVYDKITSSTPSPSSYANNAWTITNGGKSITFPLTGVRNYALRSNEWTTVQPIVTVPGFDYREFYKISMPAFRMVTLLSSATMVKKEDYNAYQVYVFMIDRKNRGNAPSTGNLKTALTPSSNSYGLPVRPIYNPPAGDN